MDQAELRHPDGESQGELQRAGAEHQRLQTVRIHADSGGQGTILRAGEDGQLLAAFNSSLL